MGVNTGLAQAQLRMKGYAIKLVEHPKWKLWMRGSKRSSWLVVGAHGGSDFNYEVPDLGGYQPMIYFLFQRGITATSWSNSWYVNTAMAGAKKKLFGQTKNPRWAKTEHWQVKDGDYAGKALTERQASQFNKAGMKTARFTYTGIVESSDMRSGEHPFDYSLTKYSEDPYIETLLDMYGEGRDGIQPMAAFDVLTIRSKAGEVWFSEILQWLSSERYHYPQVIGAFCTSYYGNKVGALDPQGTFVPAAAELRKAKDALQKPGDGNVK